MEENYLEKEEFEPSQGITFGEILYLIKKNWKLITITTLACLVCGILYILCFAKVKYSASTSIIVQDSSYEGTNGIVYSSYLTSSLKQFIQSDEVTIEVAKEVLNYRYDIKERTFKTVDGKEEEVLYKYNNGFKIEYLVKNGRYYREVNGKMTEFYFVTNKGTEYVYRVEVDENGKHIGVLIDSLNDYYQSEEISGIEDIIYIDENETTDEVITTKYYSSVLDKLWTASEYEDMIRELAEKIKRHASVSTSEDAINMVVSYSQTKDEFDTEAEVPLITTLLVKKAQEVAVRKKNTEPTYYFPIAVASQAVKYAYFNRFNITEVFAKDEDGDFILDEAGEKILTGYWNGVYNKAYSIEEFNSDIEKDATNLMRDFVVYCENGQLFYGMKVSQISKQLDDLTAYYCIKYLSDYAYNNPREQYNQEYTYPLFANTITDSGIVPTVTGTKGASKIIIISVLIGLFTSFAIALVMYLTDDTYTTRDDLEKLTGAKVFAYVDRLKKREVK